MSVRNIPLSSLFSCVVCTLKKKMGEIQDLCFSVMLVQGHLFFSVMLSRGHIPLGNVWQLLNTDNGVENPKFSERLERLDDMFSYSHIDIELKT